MSINIEEVLHKHAKWLRNEAGGVRADLSGSNLSGSDLSGSDLDFSCWPLWCGSLDVKIDKRIFCQLAYHLCRTIVNDEDCKAAQKALYPLANQFHRVDECGRLGEEGDE